VLRPLGIEFGPQDYAARYIGVSNRAMVEDLCRRFGHRYSSQLFESQYALKRSLYEQRAAALRIPQGLKEFLVTGQNRYQLGVVSSSSRLEVEPHLVQQGVRASLQVLVCAEDVARHKPHPDPYLKALDLLNQARTTALEASSCLVIEDSRPGIEAATRAGMRALRVSSPSEVDQVLEAALDSGGSWVR
jgi:beta-phosphoglucomutase